VNFDSPKLLHDISSTPTGRSFTIRLKGGRIDLLKQSLDAHSRCSSVSEIQIDFRGTDDDFPLTILRYGAGKATIVRESSTAGLFLLNEGMMFSCEDLDNAFKTWKKDPRRVVGFVAVPSENESVKQKHGSQSGHYSVLSDRATFVHSLYLDALSSFTSDSCCDVMLSIQVSLLSKVAPLLMKAAPRYVVDSVEQDDERTCHPKACQGLLSRIGGKPSLPDSDVVILLASD
jgi:hypothetical protein